MVTHDTRPVAPRGGGSRRRALGARRPGIAVWFGTVLLVAGLWGWPSPTGGRRVAWAAVATGGVLLLLSAVDWLGRRRGLRGRGRGRTADDADAGGGSGHARGDDAG